MLGVRARVRALLATLTTTSSSLSQVLKAISRALMVENFGVVWVLGGSYQWKGARSEVMKFIVVHL